MLLLLWQSLLLLLLLLSSSVHSLLSASSINQENNNKIPINSPYATTTATDAADTNIPSNSIQPASSFLSEEIWDRNRQRHAAAVAECERMYPISKMKGSNDPSMMMTWTKLSFPALGDNNHDWHSPFSEKDLARISQQPLLTAAECNLLIKEADAFRQKEHWMEGGARYGTPDDRVGALLPITPEIMPQSYNLLIHSKNNEPSLLSRIFADICAHDNFDCLPDPSTLKLGGARIVKYDASLGQVELGFHRDFLLLTANIALNDCAEYEGGGTVIEALTLQQSANRESTISKDPIDPTIRLPKGHALLHPGDVRHAANPITSGKRYVLVLFILDASDTGIPHDRYLVEYGERGLTVALQENEDMQGKDYLLNKAAQFYADALRCGARMDRGIFPWYYWQAGAAMLSSNQQ